MLSQNNKFATIASLYCLLLSTVGVSAAPADIETVSWAYSAFMGTGWYDAKDGGSVYVLRIPPSQTLRESSISESGSRQIGMQIRYPLTVGVLSIDDLPGIIDLDNFATVSFTPGIELEIPVTRHWYLRPYAHVGWGKELDTDSSAWIYYGGLKSRYTIPTVHGDWSLLGGISFAGYRPNVGESDHVGSLLIGMDFRQPLKTFDWAGEPIDLHWHLSYYNLTENLGFGLSDQEFEPLGDQVNIGIAFSFRDKPLEFWFLSFNRLGIQYSFDAGGNFQSITFNVNSWFTQ